LPNSYRDWRRAGDAKMIDAARRVERPVQGHHGGRHVIDLPAWRKHSQSCRLASDCSARTFDSSGSTPARRASLTGTDSALVVSLCCLALHSARYSQRGQTD
jgi:hypothetical protein